MSTLDSLNAKRDEANKIVRDILEKSIVLDKRLEESSKLLSQIITNSKNSGDLNSSLKSTITSTHKTIERFRAERDKIHKLLNGVNSFYDKKYIPLLSKIEDKQNGFQAHLNNSKKTTEEILKLKSSSTVQFDEVKKIASDLKSKYPELKRLDSNIRKLAVAATADSEKTKNLKESVQQLEIKIKKANTDIQVLFESSQKASKEIKNLLEGSNIDIENISKNSAESNKVLLEIQQIYNLAAQTGLSGEFERQKIQLSEDLKKWEKRIFWISVTLLIAILTLFYIELDLYDFKLKSIDVNFYLRFILFSPIIYYLYFCTTQFSDAKKLFDKYTFKTTLAMSIQNHIKMLLDEEKFDANAKDKILEFVLNGFQKIYSEPFSENNMKLGLKLQNIEMNLEKKLFEKFSELKETVKE
jgi:hypothetical protein